MPEPGLKITPEMRTAIVDEAIRNGAVPVAHIDDETDARQLVQAGLRDFLHTTVLTFGPGAGVPVDDPEPSPEFLQLALDNGVAFTPTLSIVQNGWHFAEHPDLLDDPVTALAVLVLGWWALGVLTVAVPWAVFVARQEVRHLGWTVTDDVVAVRSGWLSRRVRVARVEKIQVVKVTESPFDRRHAMAGVHVDAAGALEPPSHRVRIPYLAREVAMHLYDRLSARAATTAFRW